MNTKFKTVLATLMLSTSLFAAEGSGGGNGGDGLRIGKKVYLLDLVEAGVQEKPAIDLDIEINSAILKKTRSALISVPSVAEMVARKLSEIYLMSPSVSLQILTAIEDHSWALVDSTLVDIKDEDTSLDYDPKNLVQLAIRKNKKIMINKDQWKVLDSLNKTALIFHEAFYALVSPSDSKVYLQGCRKQKQILLNQAILLERQQVLSLVMSLPLEIVKI